MSNPFLSPLFLPVILLVAVTQSFVPPRWKRWTVLLLSIAVCAWASLPALGVCIVIAVAVRLCATFTGAGGVRTGTILAIVIAVPFLALKGSALFVPEAPVFAGLAFYTLQASGYLVERGRGKAPLLGFSETLGSMTFFPTFFAGPIVAAPVLAGGIRDAISPDTRTADRAVLRILWGYFKKFVIADRIIMLLTGLYSHPETAGSLDTIAAGILGYVRIYADYSGYADIAIGGAALLGIQLPENFRLPYMATSLRDFWRRWNITLSSWLRDYVYIPLGGNRCGVIRWGINILITFGLSGLWHGAGMRFLLWGLLHGFWMLLEKAWIRTGVKHPVLGWTLTGAFLSSTFLLLQVPDLSGVTQIMLGITRGIGGGVAWNAISSAPGILMLVSTTVMMIVESITLSKRVEVTDARWIWAGAVVLALAILHGGAFTSTPFIYTNF